MSMMKATTVTVLPATEANNSRILTAETSPALATAIALFASSTLAFLGGGPVDPLAISLIYWTKRRIPLNALLWINNGHSFLTSDT